ncbi:MAG: hypothetical protein RLZZ557_1028, partial [Bacteroidota bacterium]
MRKFLFIILLAPAMLRAQQTGYTIKGILKGLPDKT